jgi:hypothetical protein
LAVLDTQGLSPARDLGQGVGVLSLAMHSMPGPPIACLRSMSAT